MTLLVLWALSGCDCSPEPSPGPANRPPVVTILAPPNGATLRAGTPVVLMGEAVDPEEGSLTRLEWRSLLDGELGLGAQLTTQLSEGEHEITLVASDSQGAAGQDQITVIITAANTPPAAFIDSPASGHTASEGDSVALAGRGTDREDGAIPGVALFWTSDRDGALGSGASLSFAPSLGVHVVVLTAIDSEGAHGQASITIEVAPIGSNGAPTVTITQPTPDATFSEGDAVTFSGSAVDPEEGPLSGGSLSWTSDRDGPLGLGETFARADLSLGIHVVSLVAVDSEGASGSQSVTLSVNPVATTPPTATIESPASGGAFAAGATITFVGSGNDAEEGPLAGAALVWRSNVAGQLGVGSPLLVNTLAVGPHAITLTATDASGASGTDQITLTILAPNQPPQAGILAPASGARFTAGTVISFQGQGHDAEDGPLTGAALLWSSNLDGAMGSGASLDYGALTAGLHTVTLTAIDAAGLTGSDSIEILVEPAAQNLPPVARLAGPNQSTAGISVAFDGSASSDADGSIVNYRFDFGDTTPVQSGSASIASHIFAGDGTFVVTLTVTDNNGATHSASRAIRIGVATRVPILVSDVASALGSVCDLEIGPGNLPHIIYRNDTHPSLWYATPEGAAWRTEMVDGMGWDTGGRVRTDMALTLDGSGQPHIVYILDTGTSEQVRYATRSGTTWLLETLEAASNLEGRVDIEIGSTGQPVVLHTRWISGTGYVARISVRASANSWTLYPGPAGFRAGGGLELDGAGLMHVSLMSSASVYATTWTSAGWAAAAVVRSLNSTRRVPLALDAQGRDVLMHESGIAHDLGGRTWSHSNLEAGPLGNYDLSDDAAIEIYVGVEHGGQFELVHSLEGDTWQRAYAGPMDPTFFGVDSDGAGGMHACFFRSANLVYY